MKVLAFWAKKAILDSEHEFMLGGIKSALCKQLYAFRSVFSCDFSLVPVLLYWEGIIPCAATIIVDRNHSRAFSKEL